MQDGKKPPLPSALLICIPRVRRRREGGRPGRRLQWCKHKREERKYSIRGGEKTRKDGKVEKNVKYNGRMVNGFSVCQRASKELEDEKENGDDEGQVGYFAGEERWRGHELLVWVR